MSTTTFENPIATGGADGQPGVPRPRPVPGAETMTHDEYANAFLAGLEQSPEHAEYLAAQGRSDEAVRHLNEGTPMPGEEVSLQAVKDAEAAESVTREARAIREKTRSDAFVSRARELVHEAHDNGGLPGGWGRVQAEADRAGRRALREHDAKIDAEIGRRRAEQESYKARQERDQLFFDGERTDNWDMKVKALDAAVEYALAHEDDPRAMDDYNTYWGRLRAGERKAYDAYREEIENPKAPAPTEPEQPTPTVTPPTTGEGGGGTEQSRRRMPRLRDLPRLIRGRSGDKPAGAEGDNGSKRRMPDFKRLRNIKMPKWAREGWRATQDIVADLRDSRNAPASEWLDDEETAKFYRLDKYGYKAPERRQQEAVVGDFEDDTQNELARERLKKLMLQGPEESDADFDARVKREYAQNRRRYLRHADWRPLSDHFNIGEMTEGLGKALDEAHDADPEGNLHDGAEMSRRRFRSEIMARMKVTKEEAEALIEGLIQRGYFEAGEGKGRKASLTYIAPSEAEVAGAEQQ